MRSADVRVAFFHKDFEPHLGGGGTARHIHGLATALSGLGVDVRVAAPHPEKITSPYLTVSIDAPADMREQMEWADVVHLHGARSLQTYRGARLAYSMGKPFFYTPHCWYQPRSLPNAALKLLWDHVAERFLLTHCVKTIILTDVWREFLRERRLPADQTVVIPNCVLKSELKTVERRPSEQRPGPIIFSLGRLSPEKRGCDVIAALAEPELAGARLKIAGKGTDRPALESLAARLGVADRVEFLGFVSDEEVADIVAKADVFVLASAEEGLPTILLEMILAEIPVVCTNIPGNLAITEVAGVKATYDVGDVKALAGLLASPQKIDASRLACVEDRFTWEKVAPRLLSSYEEALTHDS
jgi:glycosyltransferase involved in cell wall biosynthesis